MPIIPVLGWLGTKNCKFKTSLGYIVSSRSALTTCQDSVSKKKERERERDKGKIYNNQGNHEKE
jgi:hypothetical protein